MPITCLICGTEFKSMISGKHLKQHGTTKAEYKQKYNVESLASEECRRQRSERNLGENNPNYGNKMCEASRKKISEAKKGNVPHNKGVPMSEEQKRHMSILAKQRAELGPSPLKGIPLKEEHKEKNTKEKSLTSY